MDRKPKARKSLSRKQLKSTRGGSLNTYFEEVRGQKQGKTVAVFKEVSGLKMEPDVIE